MDKKKLRTIHIEDPAGLLLRTAEKGPELKWILSYHNIEDGLDCLCIYDTREVRNGGDRPRWLHFIGQDDYLTRDMRSKKTKWLTGCIYNVMTDGGVDRFRVPAAFLTPEDRERYRQRFSDYEDPKEHYWGRSINNWQREVMDRRLEARHRKELEETDAYMAQVPEVPADFDEFIEDTVMRKYRYLIYSYRTKTRGQAYCTHCGTTMEFRRKELDPKRGEKGICPCCGSEVTFQTRKALLSSDWTDWAYLIQKIEAGFVIRAFRCHADFQDADPEGVERARHIYCRELVRGIYTRDEKGSPVQKLFEIGVYKQHGSARWCPDKDIFDCLAGILYTKNLPGELKGTTHQYSAVDLYQKAHGGIKCRVWRYLQWFSENTYFEALVKSRMIPLLDDILYSYGYYKVSDFREKIRNLTKPYKSQLRRCNGDYEMLKLIHQCLQDGVMLKDDEIIDFHKMLGGDDETLGMLNARNGKHSIRRFLKSIERYGRQYKAGNMAVSCRYRTNIESRDSARDSEWDKADYTGVVSDWKDYIRWTALLEYDLDDEYYYFPQDLVEAHDRRHKEYEDNRKKIEAKKLREQNKAFKKMMKEGTMSGFVLKAGALMIKVPQDLKEIKAEGAAQHHCVGTYVDRVAKGETMILFVRRIEAPDVPFYTMEWKGNKVVQCRGKRNADMTPEVKAFVRVFEKKMMEKLAKGQAG